MKQLQLFELEEEKKFILGKDKVDLSTLPEDPYRTNGKGQPYSSIEPGKYFVYKTGGLHFFKDYEEHGRVYPYVTCETEKKTRIIKPFVSFSDPYPKLNVANKDKIPMIVKIHRVVAFAFIKRPIGKKYTIVDHVDGNIINYSLDNLEWTTASGNLYNKRKNVSKQMELTTLLNKGK